MNYKQIKLDDFGLDVEVGILPKNALTSFLSKFGQKAVVNRYDYEQFLLKRLIKDYPQLEKKLKEFKGRDAEYLKSEIIEKIYEMNQKLNPQNIILADRQLMHVSDALKKGYPTTPTLPATPGWSESVKASALVDSELLTMFLEEVFEYVKEEYPDQNYRMSPVEMLGVDLPVLQASSVDGYEQYVVDNFIERCNNDQKGLGFSEALWVAHLVALLVPRSDALLEVLREAGYLETFSRQGIMTQIYIAITNVNPSLMYDTIDWKKYNITDLEGHVTSKTTPVGRGDKSQRGSSYRSSKQEAAKEKKKFHEVAFEKIINLDNQIKEQIKGQDEVITTVTNAIKVARTIPNTEQPVGCFLLTGPTGTGKTEFAKVLAQHLTERECIRIDCSEYQQPHEVSKIFGSPPGYVGFDGKEEGLGRGHSSSLTVASKIKKNPFSVVLFDELEKADEAIFDVLLQIMDDARVTSGAGETVSFKDAIILMTSNIGSKEAEEICGRSKMGFGEDDRDLCTLGNETIQRTIKERFKPEFRNRLTETLFFKRLDKATCNEIIDLCIEKTKSRLEEHQKIKLDYTDKVRDYILEKGYSEQYGARNLKRTVYSEIEVPIAEYLLKHRYGNIETETTKTKKVGFDPKVSEFVTLNLDIQDNKLKIDGDLHEKNSTKSKRVQYNKDSRT